MTRKQGTPPRSFWGRCTKRTSARVFSSPRPPLLIADLRDASTVLLGSHGGAHIATFGDHAIVILLLKKIGRDGCWSFLVLPQEGSCIDSLIPLDERAGDSKSCLHHHRTNETGYSVLDLNGCALYFWMCLSHFVNERSASEIREHEKALSQQDK